MQRAGQSASPACASASTLVTTGTAAGAKTVSRSDLPSASAAGAMYGLWKAPPTARRSILPPIDGARSATSPIASGEPETTVWPGALTLATHTSAPEARISPARASTSPSGAATTTPIVPSRAPAASRMARPRTATRAAARPTVRTPDATRAAYSPRLCPAQPATGPSMTPSRTASAWAINATVKTLSCARSVRRRCSSEVSSSSSGRSSPVTAETSSAIAQDGVSRQGAPMARFCVP